MAMLSVKFAVWGALANGSPTDSQAADVTGLMQQLINNNAGVVGINDQSLSDPSPGNIKHFAAIVTRDGVDRHFACQENQTINFNSGG